MSRTQSVGRRRWRSACAVAAVILAGVSRPPGPTACAMAQVVPLPPSPASSPADVDAAERLLLEFTYRRAEDERVLSKAAADLNAGRTSDALSRLQFILDEPQDAFIARSRESGYESLRKRVRDMIDSQPPPVLRQYEQRYGGEARSLLQRAIDSDQPGLLSEVVRRYFNTAAGFRAAVLQARLSLDRGHLGTAVRYLRELAAARGHQARWNSEHSRLLSVAVDSVTPRPVPVTRDYLMFAGRRDRNADSDVSLPWLTAHWSVDLTGSPASLAGRRISTWATDESTAARPPLAVSHTPVVTQGYALIRDTSSILCVDIRDGRELWRYQLARSLEAEAAAVRRSPQRGVLTSQHSHRGHSVGNQLTSNGRLVYGVDFAPYCARSRSLQFGGAIARRRMSSGPPPLAANRLVALPLAGDTLSRSRRPVWVHGGSAKPADLFRESDLNGDLSLGAHEFLWVTDLLGVTLGDFDADDDERVSLEEFQAQADVLTRRPLAGHYFLGPPLPVDDRLYAVTESKRRLAVVALAADTGTVLWSQPLGFARGAVTDDIRRAVVACSPAFEDGILVVPTQLGAVVGLDADDGTLLWVATVDQNNGGVGDAFSHAAESASLTTNDPGVIRAPVIRNGRVYIQPYESASLTCLDLHTGAVAWRTLSANGLPDNTTRRGDDFIGTVTDEIVLTIGRWHCRALDAGTGAVRWSRPVAHVAGRGFRSGDKYLLPCVDGTVRAIDLTTGAERHMASSPADWRRIAGRDYAYLTSQRRNPGNLIPVRDGLLSVNGRSMVLFPPAESVLAQERRKSAATTRTAEQELKLAQLEFTVGRSGEATVLLQRVLAGAAESPRTADVAANMLRTLTYRELDAATGGERELLERLRRIARTPAQRAAWLVREIDAQLRQQRYREAAALVERLLEVKDSDLLLAVPVSSPLERTPRAWASVFLERLRRDAPKELGVLEDQWTADTGVEALSGLVRVLPPGITRQRVTHRLAHHRLSRGRFTEAELLFRENLQHPDLTVHRQALLGLAENRARVGLQHDAQQMIEQALTTVQPRRVGDQLFRGSVEELYTLEGMRQTHRHRAAVAPIVEFSARERAAVDHDPMVDLLSRGARTWLKQTPDETLAAVIPGLSLTDQLVSVDQVHGLTLVKHPLPRMRVVSATAGGPSASCLVTVAAGHTVSALPLLTTDEPAELWSTNLQGVLDLSSTVTVGTAGSRFCTVRTPDQLIVLNALDGSLRWSRRGLPTATELQVHPVIGDDDVLVVTSFDRSRYTLFEASSGAILRGGETGFAPRTQIQTCGRNILAVSTEPRADGLTARARLWDPLTDTVLFDEELLMAEGARRLVDRMSAELCALVTVNGTVTLLNLRTGERVVELRPSVDWSDVTALRCFMDSARWFFSLTVKRDGLPTSPYMARGSGRTLYLAKGHFLVADRQSGELLWQRLLGGRIAVTLPETRLPFLITLTPQFPEPSIEFGSRRRSRTRQNLELLDAATGETLRVFEGLSADVPLYATYDPDRRRIVTHGLISQLIIEFGERLQQLQREDSVL